ncbi:MAG: hypothetical protein ACRD5J_13890, partial [Nitrososphaeraceae archaeon]
NLYLGKNIQFSKMKKKLDPSSSAVPMCQWKDLQILPISFLPIKTRKCGLNQFIIETINT